MIRFHAALLVAVLFACIPVSVGAQFGPGTEPLTITLSPEFPRPYDTVTATVGSTLINLTASTITFSVNGTVIGENERSASFTAPAPGARTTLSVRVDSPDGVYTAQKSIAPADIALIVESLSKTHPFYEGAALIPSLGRLRLVALADLRTSSGVRVANADTVYTWRLGSQILQSDSGLGKNVITATAPVRYRDAQISVTAATRDESVVAHASYSISPVDPVVRVYRSDPLSGIDFTRALTTSFTLPEDEDAFRVVSYYFANPPSIEWTLNGDVSGSRDILTVRSSGGAGSAILGVSAEDENAQADTTLTLRFGEQRRGGLFGL